MKLRLLVPIVSTLACGACSDDSGSDDDGGRSKGGSSASGTSGSGGTGGTNALGGAGGSSPLGGTGATSTGGTTGGANPTGGVGGPATGGGSGLSGAAGASTGGATGRYTCSITEDYCYCDTVFDNGPITACTGTWSCCMRGGDPEDPTDMFCECSNQTETECAADIERFGWTRETTCP